MITPPTSKQDADAGTARCDEQDTPTSPLLLIPARKAAAVCSKSLRTWRTWDSLGLIPRPVRIGRSTLWRADELRDWVSAGCPRREEWEALQ
jgi:predicted DNA-binding transcriptional regulator AlpA